MAKMTEVEVALSPNVWTLMPAREAKERKIKIGDRRCLECKGRIALLPDSRTFTAHGEHCRGQKDVYCSLKSKQQQ
jgi:hypothetical protein